MIKTGGKSIMDTKEWKEIKDLKLIDRFISGQSYSLDFAEQYMPQEKERIKRLRRAKCDKIQILEFIELRLSEDDSVLWCKNGDKQTWENPKVFETQFGKFVSDNQGEFGGQLQTPYSVVGGNFRDVFDYKDKVYAIDSLEHMLRTITVYEILRDGGMNVIYSVDFCDWEKDNVTVEEMGYRTKYVGEDLYLMVTGNIYDKIKKDLKFESRILKIMDGEIKKVYTLPEVYEEVSDLIVYNDIAYIAADKMLSVVDLQTMKSKYYTFLSSKALSNLKKTNKNRY